MKKKTFLGLTVLSSIALIAGIAVAARPTNETVGVHAEATSATTMPAGWNKEGETTDNTIAAFTDSTKGNSILLTRGNADGTLKARSTLTTVKGNTYYNVSFDAKTMDSAKLKIVVVEYKDGATALKSSVVGAVNSATNDWVSRPGMFKTQSGTNGIVVEIEAVGTGKVYVAKLFVNEGVAPDGTISSRTLYFQGTDGTAGKAEEAAFGGPGLNPVRKEITKDVLSNDSSTGYSAMKLPAGRGVYFGFDDNKITGKYTLKFRYRYITVNKSNNVHLSVRLDGCDNAGNRVYYGASPKGGWTPNGLWDSYSYEFSAKAGSAEPMYVAIYACLTDSSQASDSYYLIDDVEVIDEKGNNLIESGGFELKENAGVNTMGISDFTDPAETNWATGVFAHIPSSSYVNDGVNNTRGLHLESKKSLGISLPILAKGKYTLSFAYRTNGDPNMSVRMDGFQLSGEQFWTAPIGVANTNGEWGLTSLTFNTYGTNGAADVAFIVFNAVKEIDLDNISLKNEAGEEFVYGGNFDPLLAGGASYLGNTGAYVDSDGNIAYSSMKNLAPQHGDTVDGYLALNFASMGLDMLKVDVPYTVSFDYIGGFDGSAAGITDRNKYISDEQKRTTAWTKVEAALKTTTVYGFNNQEIRIYGNHYNVNNCFIRNISVKDADGNEYFHPMANGVSVLPQGSFIVDERAAVDEFVAAYITTPGAEDYTTIKESDRAARCKNKLQAAEGAYKRLTDAQKELFNNDAAYASARAILEQWRVNGGKLQTSLFAANNNKSGATSSSVFACTVLAASLVTFAGLAFARKKKRR